MSFVIVDAASNCEQDDCNDIVKMIKCDFKLITRNAIALSNQNFQKTHTGCKTWQILWASH